MEKDHSLRKLLDKYLKVGNRIEKYVKKKYGLRFSKKKFVADLGECYFKINCDKYFSELNQQTTATAAYDYLGTLKKRKLFQKEYSKDKLRIEVKTRHAQKSDPYLLGVKRDKFDLLVFVFLNEDYSCNYIGILDKKDLKGKIKGKQNRLIFRKSLKTIWQTKRFKKLS
jgi:hypothetical protein